MGNDHSREWVKITTNYTKNPKEKMICPICKDEFLTVTLVEEANKVLDIYFQCSKCNVHNIMSIAVPYQEKIYNIIHQDTTDN